MASKGMSSASAVHLGSQPGQLHISMGNKKIADSVALFDLPVVTTCPGAKDCLWYCYAMKQEWWGRGRPTLQHRINNLKETYKTTFVNDMVAYIKTNKIRIFRPHDSGDFYDQPYLDKWIEIAENCPETTFFCYTKSLQLVLSHFPSNFNLILSEGGKYDNKIDRSHDNYARVSEINAKTVNRGEYVCPEIRSSGKKTEKYCAYNCSYCLTSSGYGGRTNVHQVRVVFHKAKGGWTGLKLAPRPSGAVIRPLPALAAAQSQKPAQPTKSAGVALPKKAEAGEAKAASDAEIAKTVEAELAYRHLLLAGFTTQNILQLTGVRDISELRREHALQLIHAKAAEEEIVKLKPQVKVMKSRQTRKRIHHKKT